MPRYRRSKLLPPLSGYTRKDPNFGLTLSRQELFAEWYMERGLDSYGATRAATDMGLNPDWGPAIAKLPFVRRCVDRLRARAASRHEIYADMVITKWWQCANVDAREYMEIRIANCRYCHGIDHRYQFTDRELVELQLRHREMMLQLEDENLRYPFDDLGGGGYDRLAEPNPDCTECRGKGDVENPRLIWKDSRDWSPGAAMLFDGVEINAKTGSMKLKLRDRDHAMDKVAAYVIGAPVQRHLIKVFDPTMMSDEELSAAIAGITKLIPEAKVMGIDGVAEEMRE